MQRGAAERASEASQVTGSTQSQVQTEGGSVDLDRITESGGEAQGKGRGEQPVSTESTASDIVDNVTRGRSARKEPVEEVHRIAEMPSMSRSTTLSDNESQQRRSSMVATPAQQEQGTRETMQPSMHPGTSMVLNMQTGSLSVGDTPAEQGQDEANELEPQQYAGSNASRAKYDTSVESSDRNRIATKVNDEKRASSQDRERRQLEVAGREEVQREGVVTKPTPPKTLTRANRTFKKIREIIQDKAKKVTLHGKSYSGMSFYETIFSKPDLMPDCVSIGTENLIESIREPNSGLLDLVNSKILAADPNAQPFTVEECLSDITRLVDTINGVQRDDSPFIDGINIQVVLEKTPVNINHSIQVRTLRVHYGRGVGLHPTQTKGFNADYDGDPAVVNLDQSQLGRYAKAMDRLISIDGKPMLDPDFFPLERFDDKDVVLEMFKRKYFTWDPLIADMIIDAYQGACNDGDWVSLLRKIDEIADGRGRYYRTRGEYSSAILKTLYDFSIDFRALTIANQLDNVNEEHSNFSEGFAELVKGADPFVVDLVNLSDEIIAGRPCPSLQEFTLFYNKFYGDVKGKKNVPFRLLADFAKAINRTDMIRVGSDLFGINARGQQENNASVSLYDLWQFTCAAALSKQISGRCYMGSRELAASTQVRNMVLRECPIREWKNDEEFREWIYKFKDSYNINTRMLNIAQTSFRSGMRPERAGTSKFDGIGDNLENIAEALVKVYGKYTVGKLFPTLIRNTPGGKENSGSTIARYYRNMPIDKFVMNNRLVFRSERGNEGSEARFSYISRRIQDNEFNQMDILMLIADRRTKQLGDYKDSWWNTTRDQYNAVANIKKYLEAGVPVEDYNDYVENITEIIQTMSPDMFMHFGMDSPNTFMHSKWGKKLLNAQSLQEYRTHLASMMVEYRLGRPSQILDELDEAEKNTLELGVIQIERIENLSAAYENELELLASSSMAWNTIVDEMHNGNATFKMLMKSNGYYKASDGSDWVMYGREHRKIDRKTGEAAISGVQFWDRPAEEKEKYYSLVNFLKSSEPLAVKMSVLADVVRVHEQYSNMTPSEMLGQLAYHPDRLHAGNRFDMDKGIRSDIDAIKESADLLSNYMKRTPERIREEADNVINFANSDKDAFQRHLLRLANDPGYAVHIDTVFAADAIASVYDKTYDDSEKIKQQTLVNGYFGCVSYQRSGGYYTHLYMTDNAVVNSIGFDQLTPQDIVRVLADPEIELNIYDEFGTPSTISRASLCGGNTIDDVIRYLDENPRIALSCRRFMAGVASDVNGTARINAMNDNDVKDNGLYRVFSLLNDRPRFLAISALITPGDNNVGRNIAEEVNKSIEQLCGLVGYCATTEMTGMELVSFLEKKIGLNVDTVLKLRKQRTFDESEITDFDMEAASALHEEVIGELVECVDLIRKANIENIITIENPVAMIDKTSMVAYYDVRQQISGARTATMIGVEGAETKKNLVFKTYLKGRPDAYAMSENGVPIPLVGDIEQSADQSLVNDRRKLTSSICKFLEVKREMGAETFNAKYKKYGDDGSNSMIKFIRIAKRSLFEKLQKPSYSNLKDGTWSIEDAADLIERIKNCDKKFEAVPILAQALVDADIRLGYIDINDETGEIDDDSFILSDYWNRADLMLAENSDGSLVIRTLEQLSTACRNRISDEAVLSGDIDAVRAELDVIVQTLGTDMDPVLAQQNSQEVSHHCLYNVKLHSSVGKKYRVDRALRPRSSSTERNYQLLYSIFKDFKSQMENGDEVIPSRYAIETISKDMYQKLKQRRGVTKAFLRQMKGLAYPNDDWAIIGDKVGKFDKYGNPKKEIEFKENPYGSHEHIYDYLGTYDDRDLKLIPGPTSMVLFKDDIESVNTAEFNRRLSQCLQYGITAAFSGSCLDLLSDEYISNLIQVSEDIWILPCFDMRLNGSFSLSIVEGPAEIPINPDNAIVNVEDTTGEFKEGDATYHITKELADRIKVCFGKTTTLPAERLFPNVMRMFPNADYEIDYCTNEEVQKYILNADFDPETLTMKGFDDAVVDIGVIPDNSNFEREKQRFAIRLQEYKENFESSDGDSILQCDCRYDSIIGFVKIMIDKDHTVLAPVWPFHLEESGLIPTTFTVNRFELDHDTNSFNIDWAYTGGIEDQYIKAFEGIGGSNKMITSGERVRSRELENGLSVDGFYSTKSVASRLFASNKRIHTMISAMMMTRIDPKYAYNFAMDSGSFTGNPTVEREDGTVIDVKQALIEGTLGISDWKLIQKANIQYHQDEDINRLVKWWVDRCLDFGTVNPTTLLATKTDKGIMWPKITEFEAFLDPGMNFQKAWMKFMHMMNPTLMPEGIDDDPKNCLFRPISGNNSSDDYGVLQMRVPHFMEDGTRYWVPENVYISMGFFGSEFSGFKKVNFNAFRRSIDDLNVASEVNGNDLVQLLTFARAGMSNVLPSNMIEAVPDNVMKPMSKLIEEDTKLNFGPLFDLEKAVIGKSDVSPIVKQYREVVDQSFGLLFDMALERWHPNYGDGPENTHDNWVKFFDESRGIFDSESVLNNVGKNAENIESLFKAITKGKSIDDVINVMRKITQDTVGKKPTKSTIDSFRGEYDFLSNMYDSPIVWDWYGFRNAESAFQAQKVTYQRGNVGSYSSTEMEPFEDISGKEAKRLGREIDIDVREWNANKYNIMKKIVRKKFQNPELAAKLIATGDAELIEGNTWGDTYWGVSNGTGQNNLGKILMEIRDELIK